MTKYNQLQRELELLTSQLQRGLLTYEEFKQEEIYANSRCYGCD